MNEIIEYIPVIGDGLRAFKLGMKIADLFSDSWVDKNYTLQKALNHLDSAIDEEDAKGTKKESEKALILLRQTEYNKKYQHAHIRLCKAYCHYLIAISNIYLGEKPVKGYLNATLWEIFWLCNIGIGSFTSEGDYIEQLKAEGRDFRLHVKDTKKEWIENDKKAHPWKYRIRWFFPPLFLFY